MNVTWIDSHAHLDMIENNLDYSGLEGVVAISTKKDHAVSLVNFVSDQKPWIRRTVGVHPSEILDVGEYKWLEDAAKHKDVVAIGEIGLDGKIDIPLSIQISAFEKQLEIAEKLDLPVVIHSRAIDTLMIETLRKYKGRIKGVLHSFTGSLDFAKAGLDLGWMISFSGIVTFKKSDELREIARQVPIDRILVETDSPGLAPEPCRGKNNNVPANVRHVGRCIADVKGMGIAEVAEITKSNTKKLFGIKI